jgi:hypothetical protein
MPSSLIFPQVVPAALAEKVLQPVRITHDSPKCGVLLASKRRDRPPCYVVSRLSGTSTSRNKRARARHSSGGVIAAGCDEARIRERGCSGGDAVVAEADTCVGQGVPGRGSLRWN